ncbi:MULTISPECIES: 3-carboxyethylcatechol 2,3-dioxygenase [Streptomyces]|uniref:2,3-dihydroxyphenylpropionate/2,3-dihydroxicinnamic acid 1,2-dioxygenase n=1 Tax=Streptomyces scabiei (strain 87.22) TaxID=680198 RepID=C9ZEG9_STRSW|nr:MULTISPECIES: 3-carboxyethylcatechol 2,3-dioxygenase [Streptomyces]MBP5934338.1 3-carboxyethylcatechol 2,3-dioxygenase [Streptomyces sp. LBUM 1479]KFG09963.1 3-(2,3-dihydroxyphenyl)propionate dioxygenase [Streptomyces scabiei]MBP5888918.1 3-carboxyethylcatechol 2,3-dioxygenase [Streptomyces sp. LBUM 1481]MBP5918940.1 3-carboxyethylcatechol 2,3-dioxygenase [Streptomyces sp. LBUM 1483]MDX2536473.1 3-carboxyethylcatechol 2,3-dioxygenase [Streptomyces scabiei]
MTAAAVGLSHSPLIGRNDPDPEVLARVDRAVEEAREFIRAYDPELVVLYAPDHYNGFFYKEMPPFCLATEAHAVGDFGTSAGPLSVDTAAARALARGVLDQGVDLTVSARMTVDHGFAQPLEVLFGGIDKVPVVPVFVNGVATPLGPVGRVRALGTAVGRAAAEIDRRVLFLASGGLSHDPPVPVLDGAPPRVADALIEGRPPTPEQRARAEQRVVRAGRDYAAGSTEMIPINPDWDNRFLDHVENGELAAFDTWTVEGMAKEGGNSAHEVRTWIAAFASLAATGPYDLASRFYEAVPAWIAGFAVATAKGR